MRKLLYVILIALLSSLTCCGYFSENEQEGSAATAHLEKEISRLQQEGKRYEQKEDIRQALVCYWSCLDLLSEKGDSLQRGEILNRVGDLLCRYGLYEKAIENHRESYALAERMGDKKLLYETTRRLCEDYALIGLADTARYFHTLCNRIAEECCYPLLSHFNPSRTGLAAIHPELSDSIGTIYEREQLLSWESKYKLQKEQLQKEKARNEALIRTMGYLSFVIVLLILLSLFYYLKKKEEKRREEQYRWFTGILEENRCRLEEYQAELFSNSARIGELQQALDENRDTCQINAELRQELAYYTAREADIRRNEKMLRIREEKLLSESSTKAVILLNRMKSRPQYLPLQAVEDKQALFEFIDILYDGYASDVQSVSSLTERDRELCCLMRLGFSTAQLSVFYGISPGSVTKAKYRIREKMESEQRTELFEKTTA